LPCVNKDFLHGIGRALGACAGYWIGAAHDRAATEFKHALGREALDASRDLIFRNTFRDIEYALRNVLPTPRASNSSAMT
jgi:hypothetical protein